MLKDSAGLQAFQKKIWLSSPTMHGEELEYIKKAYDTNWMSTVGENIEVLENTASAYMDGMRAVALSSGTAALHLAVKLAALRLYGSRSDSGGSLCGRRVFCSDMTFGATVNPVVYEGGEPVLIDAEYNTWNMSPKALENAFALYPDVRIVVMVHLYGTPGKVGEIRRICSEHGALLIEDAAESLGATCWGQQTGSFGDYSVISFNGNKIITGSCGGMLLCHTKEDADQARKWSTQSREEAPWYQHEELGYNYRMSNVVAGVVRGQWGYLQEHIDRKREIYERYREGLKGLPVKMNPYDAEHSKPNFWLSCLLIDGDAMCESARAEQTFSYKREKGKSCPDEILDALRGINAESRPIWKPMHMQPLYQANRFVTEDGQSLDAGRDIFGRGLCLPSDIKMTGEEQTAVIEIIRGCFG